MKVGRELLKGSTELLVLKLLSNKDLYGYEIIKEATRLSSGVFQWKQGTLYPVLHNLEDQDFIVSYWEETEALRKRKYYHITEAGLQALEYKRQEWKVFVGGVTDILEGI